MTSFSEHELDLVLANLPGLARDGELVCRRADRGGPLAAPIARMLAVAEELSVASLLAGLHRTHAAGRRVHWVDESMLTTYLRAQPGYRLSGGGTVRAYPPISRQDKNTVLTRDDQVIASIGRGAEEMSYTELVAALCAAGYSGGASGALLARSPLLVPLARGRCRLRRSRSVVSSLR